VIVFVCIRVLFASGFTSETLFGLSSATGFSIFGLGFVFYIWVSVCVIDLIFVVCDETQTPTPTTMCHFLQHRRISKNSDRLGILVAWTIVRYLYHRRLFRRSRRTPTGSLFPLVALQSVLRFTRILPFAAATAASSTIHFLACFSTAHS